MPRLFQGMMQSTVTPMKPDFSLDLDTLERLVDWHIRIGTTAISWPHHKSESLNMTIAERKAGAEAVVRAVAKRVPCSIHVSALAVEDSMELARHAEKIGADAIIGITPYFWHPTIDSLYDYFVRLGTLTSLPMICYNSPDYLSGLEFTGDLTRRLIERLPNFIAMKEASFNSERFLEISRVALAMRPDFSMIAGVEFLAMSVPLGGAGSYSSSGAICPNLCNALYDACASGNAKLARELQFKLARLWDLFRDQYPSSLKGGTVIMGRPVGPTRPPLPTASKERIDYIAKQLEELGVLDTEPHGW
jgi:4-hydroxy-tetrahydrodipicolinate synthase